MESTSIHVRNTAPSTSTEKIGAPFCARFWREKRPGPGPLQAEGAWAAAPGPGDADPGRLMSTRGDLRNFPDLHFRVIQDLVPLGELVLVRVVLTAKTSKPEDLKTHQTEPVAMTTHH